MKIFTTPSKDLKNSLVKFKGFEVIGQYGDNITMPIIFTLHGDERKLTQRQLPGLQTPKFEQTRSSSLYRRNKK